MAIILGASFTGLKAEQYNEYLFDYGDGSTGGINRMELATYPPEDAAQFLSILEDQYGKARLGELQQEDYMVPIDQDTESAGGLVETSIEEEFMDLEVDEEGFLSASVEQSPAKYGISADLALVDSFPTSIYLESIPNKESDLVSSTCDSFPVTINTTKGIPDDNWQSYSGGTDGYGVKIAFNIEQKNAVPGPAGSKIQCKISYSGHADGGGKRWKVKPNLQYAGRIVTERDRDFHAKASGEMKLFWGTEPKKFEGKKVGVSYKGSYKAEIGLKGSIGASFGATNKFSDRNDSRSGTVDLDGKIRFAVSAYAEGNAKVEWKILNGKWRTIEVGAGVELTGTVSLGMGYVSKDWDHTLKETHPTKKTESYMRAWGTSLSYRAEGYVKFKVLGLEIKPNFRHAGSRSFPGEKTIKFGSISALDKYM